MHLNAHKNRPCHSWNVQNYSHVIRNPIKCIDLTFKTEIFAHLTSLYAFACTSAVLYFFYFSIFFAEKFVVWNLIRCSIFHQRTQSGNQKKKQVNAEATCRGNELERNGNPVLLRGIHRNGAGIDDRDDFEHAK